MGVNPIRIRFRFKSLSVLAVVDFPELAKARQGRSTSTTREDIRDDDPPAVDLRCGDCSGPGCMDCEYLADLIDDDDHDDVMAMTDIAIHRAHTKLHKKT